jgi:hypothetical protein
MFFTPSPWPSPARGEGGYKTSERSEHLNENCRGSVILWLSNMGNQIRVNPKSSPQQVKKRYGRSADIRASDLAEIMQDERCLTYSDTAHQYQAELILWTEC